MALMLLLSLLTGSASATTSYSDVKTEFIKVGTTKFAYRKFGEKSEIPLVLLMHTRGNMDGWDPELVDLLAAKRTVIAFDNSGVGLSEGQTPDNFAAMADDAARFISALNYKKVDVLGFSIGGAIAQELLIRHNHIVRRAILAGTSAMGGDGVNQLSEKSKSVSTKKEMTDDDLLYAFFAPSNASQKMGKQYLSRIKNRKNDKDVAVSMSAVKAQAIARNSWGAPQSKPDERLKNISNPILIANGKDDIRMPTINSYNLFKVIPKAQIILYPDSGHGFLFQYPKLCAENFSTFLDQKEVSD
ncbi:alpha/beta fold hydrolase [Bdellovibrio sp. HCB209]|uniref:alpha/beta fold hydrolase n=1 Tax=Bdellovibrio sp. HCB209 TaxID=3394354 RepID=UPI0039B3A9AF